MGRTAICQYDSRFQAVFLHSRIILQIKKTNQNFITEKIISDLTPKKNVLLLISFLMVIYGENTFRDDGECSALMPQMANCCIKI